jgi:ferrous iron transport protein A
MSEASSHLSPLADLPLGASARLAEIRGGHKLARRLLGLGLRVGSRITVLHHRGRGVVLSYGDTRVALGGGIVERLWVEPIDAPREPTLPSEVVD